MTITGVGQPTSAPPQPPPPRQTLRTAARSIVAGTPGHMRIFAAASVLGCLVFGVTAFLAASNRAAALASARSDAAQLVRVQAIRTNLVLADANLTNAFLVGGLELPAARSAYQRGIATASSTVADASGVNANDATVLAKVNDVVTKYTGLVESARADNRLGYPLGAAYLRQATNLLRTGALPVLKDLGKTEQTRIEHAYSASARAMSWLLFGLPAALAVLFITQVWLAGRTRRLLNLPLVAAAAAVLVVGAVLIGAMAWSQSKANDTRNNAYFATIELTTARIDAFDAKSAESLTLIARGSGQSYEASFTDLAANTKLLLDEAATRGGADERSAQATFATYRGVHTKIRTADDSGDWDGAVRLATGSAGTSSNAAFSSFDTSSAKALSHRSAQLRHDLGAARTPLTPFAWIALIVGLVAAASSVRGISLRLREYR
jgi:hypothetical protein